MVALELEDIQGNILRGYGSAQAVYLFFEMPDAGSGRRFLGELVDGVQDSAPWGPVPPTTTMNIAVTYAGLRALGVAATILADLPDAFRQPHRERAATLLDDTGPSAPEHWVDGLGTEHSHLLVTVNAKDGSEEAFAAATDEIRHCAERHGVTLVHEQVAGALHNRREHFGWADGFGQPAIEGTPWPSKAGEGTPTKDGWRDLKAGEFVHGYPDEDGQTVSGAAAGLLRNGTYMVYRKLYQDVTRFRTHLYDDAKQYGRARHDEPPLDADQLYELMAAKVVGRWRDGVAIEVEPTRSADQSRGLGDAAVDEPSNDFRYWSDRDGSKCPKGAHIRRTNPRDALGWEGDGVMSLSHRIIRRGMPYGPFLPLRKDPQTQDLVDDGQDRGLIFVCFNAHLDRQFEIVQRQWCDDGNAFGLGNDNDYLLGDHTGPPPPPAADGRLNTGRVTIQGDPPHFVQAQTGVVLTRGSEYLLMPGLASLRDLARGAWGAHGEVTPPEEALAIEQIVSLARATLEHNYPAGVRPVRRDQHAKAHGCVRAELEVTADVPARLRHGLFREPGTYPAWIRFSSSAPGPKPPADSKRDAHGMAIKVMGVEGPKVMASERDAQTQDLIVANSKVFFCRNASDYVQLATKMSEGKFLQFFFGLKPFRFRLREFVNVMVATQQKIANPLQIRYWSQTPAALGPHAVKYSAEPRSETKGSNPKPASTGNDSLEDAMKRQLDAGGCSFDFMVQVQVDPTVMPVEDPTIPWKERLSPFQKVATIRIPAQQFTSDAQKAFAENLTFTPWHTLPEHRPLGGINRVRRVVYEVMSELRHEKNGVAQHEPTADELPSS
ncbi:MAG: catalase [Acidimicrobiales bacterium]